MMLKFYLIASTLLFLITVVDLIINSDATTPMFKVARALLFIPMLVIGSILLYTEFT